MLINKGFTMVKIFKKTYFAQCNKGNTQKEHIREKEKRSEAEQSNIILLYYYHVNHL